MPTFVAMGMQFFTHPTDAAWARGNAQWVKDNTEALAAQAALVDPGGAGERTSYFGVWEVDETTGALTLVTAWHLDGSGVVRPGLPGEAEPPPPADEWAPGVAYAVDDEVTYLVVRYRCLQAHTSQVGWEPPNVSALWAVV